jgi:hypothetical protein
VKHGSGNEREGEKFPKKRDRATVAQDDKEGKKGKSNFWTCKTCMQANPAIKPTCKACRRQRMETCAVCGLTLEYRLLRAHIRMCLLSRNQIDLKWASKNDDRKRAERPEAKSEEQLSFGKYNWSRKLYRRRLCKGATKQDCEGWVYVKVRDKYSRTHASAPMVKIGRALDKNKRYVRGFKIVFSEKVKNHKAMESCVHKLLHKSRILEWSENRSVPNDGRTEWFEIKVAEAKEAINYAIRESHGLFTRLSHGL